MIFNFVFGLQEIDRDKLTIFNREAVRGVIFKNDKILMVHSNKGDYKFPGGGVDKDKNHEDALEREVREETGYIISSVKEKMGVAIQRNPDMFQKDAVFEMISHYYLCEVSEERVDQQLDDYEQQLDFTPVWMDLDEVIALNEKILQGDSKDKNLWVQRETAVLKAIKE